MLIFLDIDGVLVPAAGWKAPQLLEDGFPMFTSKATKALQQLLSDTTTIILSTSHRNRFTIDQWKTIFKNRGLNIGSLKLLASNYNSRKDEILGWFNTHNVHEDFVIIDDDTTLNALPQYLKEHLILTSPLVGLTSEHVAEIKSSLHTA